MNTSLYLIHDTETISLINNGIDMLSNVDLVISNLEGDIMNKMVSISLNIIDTLFKFNTNINYESFMLNNNVKIINNSLTMVNHATQNYAYSFYTWSFTAEVNNYWTKIINASYIRLHDLLELLLALLVYLVNSTNNSLISTLYLLFKKLNSLIIKLIILSNKFKGILYIVSIFSQFKFAIASSLSSANSELLDITTSLGWPTYAALNALYDKHYITFIRNEPNMFKLTTDSSYNWPRLILGLIFIVNIFVGVLFSTSFSYLVLSDDLTNNIIWGVISIVISYISALIWSVLIIFSVHDLLPQNTISILRGLFDSILFNFLSVANFVIWYYWSMLPYSNILAIVVGISLYVPCIFFQIHIEQTLNGLPVYGIFYILTFSSLSLFTSALYVLYEPYSQMSYNILIIVLSFVLLVIFPLEYYRITDLINVRDSSFTSRFWAASRFLLTFIAFTMPTFIILSWFL